MGESKSVYIVTQEGESIPNLCSLSIMGDRLCHGRLTSIESPWDNCAGLNDRVKWSYVSSYWEFIRNSALLSHTFRSWAEVDHLLGN